VQPWSESVRRFWDPGINNQTKKTEYGKGQEKMINALIEIVHILARLLIVIILLDVILGYFMSPYHPVKQALDRLMEPFLRPIRRLVPTVGMFDFSPLILMIFIQVLDVILTNLLGYIR
jgi:YggT family protein